MRPGPVPPHAVKHTRARRLEERLAALERSPGIAPLVDADPAPDSPVRLWRMTDGRLRWRDAAGAVHEAAEATPGPATSSPALPDTDPAPATYSGEWTAQWAASYVTGESPPPAGTFGAGVRMMIGFPSAVNTELAGALEITAVQVWLYNTEGDTDEVRTGIGWHDQAAHTGTYSGSAPLSRVDLPRIGSPGWRRIDRSIGREFADGTARGLVIDQAATDQATGRLALTPERAPRLRITYRA